MSITESSSSSSSEDADEAEAAGEVDIDESGWKSRCRGRWNDRKSGCKDMKVSGCSGMMVINSLSGVNSGLTTLWFSHRVGRSQGVVVSGVIVAAGVAIGVGVAAGVAAGVGVGASGVVAKGAATAMADAFVTMKSGLHLMMLMANIMILEVLTSLLGMSMLKSAVP